MNIITPLDETPADDVTVLHTRIVTGTGGGPEKTIFNSPRYMRGTGYRELACYLRPPGDPGFEVLRGRATAKGCPLIEVDDASAFSPASLRRLAAICRENDVKVWHGHDYKTNLFGVLLKPLLGFKLVTTVHGWVKHTPKTPLYYAIDRWTLPRHDQVIVVSSDLYERCRAGGVPEDRLHLIENAIDTEDFRRSGPAALAAERGRLPPGRLLVGAVGRLSPEKGFDLLIRAVAALIDEGLDLELWIAGEGEEKAALEAQAAATGHGDRIRLTGFRSDTVALFECFDLFCLSSLREGLPNVVLEAMAMEVPVLATRCGGIDGFARDGSDMLTVEAGSAEALAGGLCRLAGDPALRHRLAGAARRRIEAEFSFRRRMDRMAEVYGLLW
ncbi:glycosyltransferase family 4 protein [Skermanella mucosa]|uniref:glycosyltransferase family 4 protein n=1 Tax=Skermanella mucosa TaxID=1789672 RepID=UPI00192AE6BB|nr:glycosyltransferase family 4 protein [Skermanella mucosa]UEM22917.1 glycosyltransferase family 4 protein [Skermanella mucosa]